MNIQLESLRPQINLENNDKQSDEIYQINIIDDKESNEIDHISEKNEETFNTYIEVLIMQTFILQKKKTTLRKVLMK